MTETNALTNEGVVPNNDQILEMFFDKDFVPQAYVDILLSNAASQNLTHAQTVSSTLLARLDYYTKHLTNEIKSSIENLRQLSETMHNTSWHGTTNTLHSEHSISNIGQEQLGSSKLEYYSETLRSSVRALEADMTTMDKKLEELKTNYESSDNVAKQLEKLVIAKNRLTVVIQCFEKIKSIFEIASKDSDENITDTTNDDISVKDFETSLQYLEASILESLSELPKDQTSSIKQEELLNRIKQLVELTPFFEGLHQFHAPYSHFSKKIKSVGDAYQENKRKSNMT